MSNLAQAALGIRRKRTDRIADATLPGLSMATFFRDVVGASTLAVNGDQRRIQFMNSLALLDGLRVS